jgi:hypothetical protein
MRCYSEDGFVLYLLSAHRPNFILAAASERRTVTTYNTYYTITIIISVGEAVRTHQQYLYYLTTMHPQHSFEVWPCWDVFQ